MVYDITAKRINCNYSCGCSTLQRADSFQYKNLIQNHCSNLGKECGTKLKLINKELIRK